MIHTDGKPTIANTRLSMATDPNLLRKYPERDLWETCPCAECSERTEPDYCAWCSDGIDSPPYCGNVGCKENPDPDSMPGGYDNPQEPYDWKDDVPCQTCGGRGVVDLSRVPCPDCTIGRQAKGQVGG